MMDTQSNIVLTILDSVRADHTSLCDKKLDTTPELERIATEGASFSNCFAHGTGTAASVASILTGVPPSAHQVAMNENVGQIPSELNTLPTVLSEVGYTTICVTSNPRLDLIGAAESFDQYIEVSRSTLLESQNIPLVARYLSNFQHHSAGLTTSAVEMSLGYFVTEIAKRSIRNTSDPYFLYVHYNEPHRPYYPPLVTRREFAQRRGVTTEDALEASMKIHDKSEAYNAGVLSISDDEWNSIEAMYDAEIAYTDRLVGRLFHEVDDALFAVTADHGELLGEYGAFGHGEGLASEEETHVPLVIHGIDELSGTDDRLVQHSDLVGTLCSAADVRMSQIEGTPLIETARDFTVSQDFTASYDTYTELNSDFKTGRRGHGRINAIRTTDQIFVLSDNSSLLYNLDNRGTDISTSSPEVVEQVRSDFVEWRTLHGEPVVETVGRDDYNEATKRRLRELGYRE